MRYVVPALLTLVFGAFLTAIIAMTSFWVVWEKPDAQPIAYPHDFHAGTGITQLSEGKVAAGLGLKCIQCHVYVDKSRYATVPALSVCADCHKNVPAETEQLKKLQYYIDNNIAPIWQRIHSVPNHVYFSHKRHVKYFEEQGKSAEDGTACQSCHGDMRVVQTVKQTRTLNMGFCISCHRANNAPQDCWTCHK